MEDNKRSLAFRPLDTSPSSGKHSTTLPTNTNQDTSSTEGSGGDKSSRESRNAGTIDDNKQSLPFMPNDASISALSDLEFWLARGDEYCNTPIDSGSQPLPPNWNEECDHYIVYLRHAPTVCTMHKTYEHIYANITGVYPWLGRGFYKTFETHLTKLSEETRNGKTMLPVIAKKKYWWAFDPDNSAFVRRNPRRATRGDLPDSN